MLSTTGKLSNYKHVEERWYALYTKHQHEKKAADLLKRKGIEVFLPTYSAIRQWKDRRKALALPLFPNYLFLRTNLDNKIEILQTPGVFSIVENSGRACEIPDHEIETLQTILRTKSQIEPHEFLRRGDSVLIRLGPLAGVRGFLTMVKNQHRVVVSVTGLQKAISVEIELSSVEKVHIARNQVILTSCNQG